MSDVEPQPINEGLISSVEQNAPLKIRRLAEQLGHHTESVFGDVKNSSRRFLERAWYTHNASLLLLESMGIKTLAMGSQEYRKEAMMAGKIPLSMGVGVHSEQFVKRLGKEISVGEHMSVHPGHYRSIIGKHLSDGTTIKPGQKIGVIHFVRNLPVMGTNESLIGFSRRLFESGEESLRKLAVLCESNDPRLERMDFFYGLSHLAGSLAKRLGFDIFEIANPINRVVISVIGRSIAKETTSRNDQWNQIEKKFKFPREAFISRQKLVELYGSKQPQTN